MKKVLLFIVSLSFGSLICAQEKSWWAGHALTRASFDGVMNKGKQVFPLGTGFSLMRKRGFKKSAVSYLCYGVDIYSVRHSFYINGSSDWMVNTKVKVPIAYRFESKLAKHMKLVFNLGISLQSSNEGILKTALFNNGTKYEIHRLKSIVPFALLSGGTNFTTKKNHCFEVLIGLNKGFVPLQKIIYQSTNPKSVSTIFSDGTYAFVTFNWRLFKSGY